MIDPRALQQHFRKVHQRQEPKDTPVPRIPDIKPLTAIEAITVQEDVLLSTQTAIEESMLTVNLVIDIPPPIDKIIIDESEFEEELVKESNSYDPYEYYRSSNF